MMNDEVVLICVTQNNKKKKTKYNQFVMCIVVMVLILEKLIDLLSRDHQPSRHHIEGFQSYLLKLLYHIILLQPAGQR